MTKQQYNGLSDQDRMNCTLKGVLYYASVQKPNPGYKGKDPNYVVNLGLETKDEIKKAEGYGLKIKEANDTIPLPYVVVRKKIKNRDPEQVRPPVVDEMQNEFPREVLIGNGSKGIIKFALYWWGEDDIGSNPDDPDGGVGHTLLKTQVTDLIVFKPEAPKDSSLENNEDGFNINTFLAENPDAASTDVESTSDEGDVKEEKNKSASISDDDSDIFDD